MPKTPIECPIPNAIGNLGLTGPSDSDILVVAEASGHNEAYKGKQFVGRAGTMLNKLFEAAGLDRDRCCFVNVLRCHPPNDWLVNAPWELRALDCCRNHLNKALDDRQWKVIICLGSTATREVLQLSRVRGKEGIKLDNFHGAPVWDDQRKTWIVPTYHPSHLQQGAQRLFRTVVWDLKKALEIHRGEWSYDQPELIGDPTPEWFHSWVDGVLESDYYWLMIDTETPDKGGQAEDQLKGRDSSWQILYYNFAVSPDQGVSIPNLPQYSSDVDRLLNDERSWKFIWHRNFDLPRMEAEGRRVGGEVHEAMDLWHTVQSNLPRSLGFVAPHFCDNWPWKHLPNTDPQYRCLDAVWLYKIVEGCIVMIKAKGIGQVYHRHHYLVDRWALLPATKKGIPFNRVALQAWTDNLSQEEIDLQQEVQGMVPEKILRLEPKNGLKKKPEGEEGLVEKTEAQPVKKCLTCGEFPVAKTHRCKDEKGKIDRSLEPKVEFSEEKVTRWYRRTPFNPGSWQQVLARIKAVGHKPGKHKKTKRDTTDKKTLKRLIKTGDSFYKKCLDYRDVSKMRGTYGKGILDKLDESNRLHGTYTNKPWTFRKASQDPNLQNLPSHARLAKGFLETVEAEPGCELAIIDFSGIEAVLTGWCIWDPEYIRLARLGIHAYLCSHFVSRYLNEGEAADKNWPLEKLAPFLKAIKKKYDGEPHEPYPRSKRVVHGYNYGLTEWGMVEQFPESFPNLASARQIRNLYEELCPGLPAWHLKIWQIADDNKGFGGPPGPGNPLPHPFHFPFHFYQVKNWRKKKDGNWAWTPGEDAKKAASAFPQSIASGIMDETMLDLFMPGEDDSCYIGDAFRGQTPLLAQVHDALLVEYERGDRDYVLGRMVRSMTRPIQELPIDPEWGMGSHLTIDVEIKVGQTWGGSTILSGDTLATDVYHEEDDEEDDDEWDV